MRSEKELQLRQKSRLSFLFHFSFIVVASEDNFTRRDSKSCADDENMGTFRQTLMTVRGMIKIMGDDCLADECVLVDHIGKKFYFLAHRQRTKCCGFHFRSEFCRTEQLVVSLTIHLGCKVQPLNLNL